MNVGFTSSTMLFKTLSLYFHGYEEGIRWNFILPTASQNSKVVVGQDTKLSTNDTQVHEKESLLKLVASLAT